MNKVKREHLLMDKSLFYADKNNEGVHYYQDNSDVDSGIVSGSDQKTASTSSSTDETDGSSSSVKDKFERNPAVLDLRCDCTSVGRCGVRQKSRFYSIGNLGIPDTTESRGQPIRGCNRRPPTPLSVFSSSTSCRTDNNHDHHQPVGAHLSEQTLRRSCRKIFATLYAQRFPPLSSVNHEDGETREAMCIQNRMEQRARSRTLSDFELKKYGAAMLSDHRTHPYLSQSQVTEALGGTNDFRYKKAVTWNLKSNNKCDCALECSTPISRTYHDGNKNLPSEETNSSSRVSTSYRSRWPSPNVTSRYCSRENSNSSQYATSSNTACFQQCSCYTTSIPNEDANMNVLSKSASCSVLPTVDELEIQKDDNDSILSISSKSQVLKRTPSTSNLRNNTNGGSMCGLQPCKDNSMVHVYAHVASVVPDDIKSNQKTTLNLEDKRNQKSDCGSVSYRDLAIVRNLGSSCDCCYQNISAKDSGGPDRTCQLVRSDAHSRTDISHSDCPKAVIRSNLRTRTVIAAIRPTTTSSSSQDYAGQQMIRPSRNNGKISLQPDFLTVSANGEVEYAVVDKSKKSKFAVSLPTLSHFNASSNANLEENEQHPPVPPKKNLHKSDFSLYRKQDGGGNSRKGFFERFQDLTKSAKNAFQKAFSTERIYRPEKEERLEATKLQRTKSFMRGIRASISRNKRKKNRTPLAEVVPQSSSNTVWNEDDFVGPNVRGQLLQLNLDGSQVVELSKAPSKPYGFFVARGRVHNSKGVFVSRMRDQETQKQLAGLLDIGDEILEVEGMDVKNADIMEVNDLISKKNTLLLTVLPYICRKDI